jgi:large subunit ribosomal protein L24
MKYKIKRNDTVKVIAGKEKGKTGKVRSVLREDNKVIVEGVNMITKHVKRTAESAGHKFKREAALHISNVALFNPESNEIVKVGFQNVVGEDGKRRSVRINKKTNQPID